MNKNLTGGRLAAIIAGGAIASLATLVLLAGAGFQWLDNQRDADGYYTTSSERFETGTYALTSENLDIDDGFPGSGADTRLKVNAENGKPVFVGVARTSDVETYLVQSAHATLTDIEVKPFDASYKTIGGPVKPAAPATQSFWIAKSQGTGTQTLDWDVKDGQWSIVVMNADGSPGVHADISAGADLPFVGAVATALIIAGLGGLGIGAALLAFGFIVHGRPTHALESATGLMPAGRDARASRSTTPRRPSSRSRPTAVGRAGTGRRARARGTRRPR